MGGGVGAGRAGATGATGPTARPAAGGMSEPGADPVGGWL
jgi:hypothetical protein